MENLFRLLALVRCFIFVSCAGDIKISIFTRDLVRGFAPLGKYIKIEYV